MRKKILLLTTFVIGALVASAQFVGSDRSSSSSGKFFSTEKADQGVTIGIRGGLNISGFKATYRTDNHSFKNAIGYKAGVAVNIPIVRSVYVETGAYFTAKNVKATHSSGGHVRKLNPSFVEIPILASYRYDISNHLQLQVKFGPYFAFGVTGKYKWDDADDGLNLFSTTSSEGTRSSFDGAVKRLMKPFDAGICVGAGVLINKHWSIGFEYEPGLVDLVDNGSSWLALRSSGLEPFSIKTHNFSVSIGYDF